MLALVAVLAEVRIVKAVGINSKHDVHIKRWTRIEQTGFVPRQMDKTENQRKQRRQAFV